ncbi:hypothetical protein B8V81_0172 [Paenibacillus pasadenensis]|uniref:Uncharacterized protein n=1 Tax=Paenibacillus pasadenensis TaxID=217090 RepID=A0A2N5NCQ2_9BACL|nr:hypothetical protein B8V81_0172 [Paenibacillus pasadenensis]
MTPSLTTIWSPTMTKSRMKIPSSTQMVSSMTTWTPTMTASPTTIWTSMLMTK